MEGADDTSEQWRQSNIGILPMVCCFNGVNWNPCHWRSHAQATFLFQLLVLTWLKIKVCWSRACHFNFQAQTDGPTKILQDLWMGKRSVKLSYIITRLLKFVSALILFLPLSQCDQMARLFFNIWPFTTTKICQIVPNLVHNFAK